MRKAWKADMESAPAGTQGRELGGGWRDVLRGERWRVRGMLPTAVASTPDPVDAAREREDEAVRLAVLQRLYEVDTTAEEVLQSLATGQYGRCIECGRHIALARLRAMPLAVRCLDCQERFERTARIAAARARVLR